MVVIVHGDIVCFIISKFAPNETIVSENRISFLFGRLTIDYVKLVRNFDKIGISNWNHFKCSTDNDNNMWLTCELDLN